MIWMKNLRFSSRPGAKVGRQGPAGSARALLWLSTLKLNENTVYACNQIETCLNVPVAPNPVDVPLPKAEVCPGAWKTPVPVVLFAWLPNRLAPVDPKPLNEAVWTKQYNINIYKKMHFFFSFKNGWFLFYSYQTSINQVNRIWLRMSLACNAKHAHQLLL